MERLTILRPRLGDPDTTTMQKKKVIEAIEELQILVPQFNSEWPYENDTDPTESETYQKIQKAIGFISHDRKSSLNALAKKKAAQIILASLGKERKLESLNELWATAKNLSNLFASMVGDISPLVIKKDQEASIQEEEDSTKTKQSDSQNTPQVESTPSLSPSTSIRSGNELLQRFERKSRGVYSSISRKKSSDKIPTKETFEESVEAITRHIQSAQSFAQKYIADTNPILEVSAEITSQFEKILVSSKTGSREDLITAGKNIHTAVLRLEQSIRQMSNTTDPKLADRITRSVEALRNYSTQLKILVTVRAAGGVSTSSSDAAIQPDQLVSISRMFGHALTDLLGSATEQHLRGKKKKSIEH